jgi:hypothetical protein
MDDEEEDDKLIMPPFRPLILLRRKHCQLTKLSESLVVLYFNVKNGLTELWFLEDMEDDTTGRWSKRLDIIK